MTLPYDYRPSDASSHTPDGYTERQDARLEMDWEARDAANERDNERGERDRDTDRDNDTLREQ